MHRDLIQSSGSRAEVIFKNESLYGHHGGTSSPCNFFTGVGRNGVLPQGFDQFLDTPNSDKLGAELPKQKTDSAAPGDEANNNNDDSESLTKLEQDKADPSGSVDEDSSSNCGDKSSQQSKSPFSSSFVLQGVHSGTIAGSAPRYASSAVAVHGYVAPL